MARPKKVVQELQVVKEANTLVYKDFDTAKADYLDHAKKIISGTDFLAMKVSPTWWINNNIIKPMQYFKERRSRRDSFWTNNELEQAFELLIQITNLINEETRYQPQIGDYCRMLGITQSTFYQWTYENNERGEQARFVQDYFRSMLAQGICTGEINAVAGSFVGKTMLGLKEDNGTQININVASDSLTVDEIMEKYHALKK